MEIEIKKILKVIVSLLVAGAYDQLAESQPASRMTAEEIRKSIEDYPGKITMPPCEAYDDFYSIAVSVSKFPRWAVDFDLWYDGARSDNTLQCTISYQNQNWVWEIDDIHVM